MLELDGSQGEGGGQILRTSLALALVTGKAFHPKNIRARRPKPGLHPQHLMCVRAGGQIGGATMKGASLHSSDLVFEPGPVKQGKYHFAIGTAGATGLVLHTLYLPLALMGPDPSEVTLEGGTHVSTSPCFHFLETTWRAYMELLGLRMKLTMRRPGFYPRGGGLVEVHIQPCAELKNLDLLERSASTSVSGFSAVADLPEAIARRQARQFTKRLQETSLKVHIQEEIWNNGPGTVLGLTLDTKPVPTLFFGLGERGKRAERVADEAVEQVLCCLEADSGAVDLHSTDQIVLPLALAKGPSTFTTTEITSHLLTNVEIIRQFVDREIVCEGDRGSPGTVRIR